MIKPPGSLLPCCAVSTPASKSVMTRRFHAGTQVRAIMEELGMRYTTPSSMGPDGVLTTSDVYGNEVIAKARGHVGESTGATNQPLMLYTAKHAC